MFTS
ncbi:hypothetical protein VCHENC02_1199A, partial [Vibrio harveyi]|jgi:nuclear pore complex protein Nup188